MNNKDLDNVGNKKIHRFFYDKVETNIFYKLLFNDLSSLSRNLKLLMTDEISKNGISNLIHVVCRMVDDAVALDLDRGIKVDCEAGCNHCCHQDVGVTLPEASLVLLGSNGEHLKHEDALKIQYEAGSLESLKPKRKAKCIFLTRSGCSIYDCRPIPCRLLYSKSSTHCKQEGVSDPVVMLYAETVYLTYLEVVREAGILKPSKDNTLNRVLYLDCIMGSRK